MHCKKNHPHANSETRDSQDCLSPGAEPSTSLQEAQNFMPEIIVTSINSFHVSAIGKLLQSFESCGMIPKKKERKKENVKINDLESEFWTAKTAFNVKSLIQL